MQNRKHAGNDILLFGDKEDIHLLMSGECNIYIY